MSRTFASFSHRNYRWFISGQAVTNIGTWMQRIAQDWLVLEVTHGNAVALGLVTALQFLPFLLLTPFTGVVADRFSRRAVLMVTGAAGGTAAAALAVTTMAGATTLGVILAAGAVLGVASAFDHPARQALLGELVGPDELRNAVALNGATFNMARIVGPALAGLGIAALGTGPVFAVNAASFAVAVWTLTRLRSADFHLVARSAERVTFTAGLRYLRSRSDLVFVILAVALAAVFAFNFALTTALMATAEFDRGAAEYGLLGTSLALGSITGSLLAARRRAPIDLRYVFAAGVAFGLVTATAGLMPNYLTFVLFLPLAGLTALTFSIGAQSYLQLHTDPGMRGRVMGFYALVFFGSNPVGAPLLGWISMQFGPRWALIGGGLLAAAALTLLSLWAAHRGIFAAGRAVAIRAVDEDGGDEQRERKPVRVG
ncbi:MAG: MFS transporter [Actinobacteria bacterium]|nr:MFS transporter [Actinomycetota bacterium]MCB9413534.1 MFS transporter [Actinomycetota bacterium]